MIKGVIMGGAGGAAAPSIIRKIKGKRGKIGLKRMFCPLNNLAQYVLPPQFQNHNYILDPVDSVKIRIRPNPLIIRTESESLISISKSPRFSEKDSTKHLIVINILHFLV